MPERHWDRTTLEDPGGPGFGQQARTLRGEVEREGEPVVGERVTLHRVSAETAGEVRTGTTDERGTFSLTLPESDPGLESEAGDEVYFASVRYQGVLYFGPALTGESQLDSIYRIEVYDTVAAPSGGADLLVSARNLFVERDPEGGWQVVDLLQVRNEGTRTFVADEGDVAWSYPLPEEGRAFEVVEGESGSRGVTIFEGGLSVTAPLPPGERTYVVRYRLDEPVFSLPLPGRSERVEMLVQEPAPPLEVSGLSRAEAVELEPGRSYRRFSGSHLENRVVEVALSEEDGRVAPGWIAVLLGLVLTGGAAFVLARPKEPDTPDAVRDRRPADEISDQRTALLLRVAELDRRFQEKADPSDAERDRYEEERARILAQIRELE